MCIGVCRGCVYNSVSVYIWGHGYAACVYRHVCIYEVCGYTAGVYRQVCRVVCVYTGMCLCIDVF